MKPMITQNEIRVGNIFYFPFHKQNVSIVGYAKIEKDDSFKVQFETNGGILLEPLSVLQPIPLSEDILLKCGFEYERGFLADFDGKMFFPIQLNEKPENGFYCYLGEWNRVDEQYSIGYIKYLHQLQNLYFVLTNKELIINGRNNN